MNRLATTLCRAIVPILLATAVAPEARAGLVYDNTSTGTTGFAATGSSQLANKVTAAAGFRNVTELDLGVTSLGSPVTANMQAFLYANDGVNGSPGTLLWSSAVNAITVNSTNALIAFSVPSILVSDTFTFAASITNASGTLGYVPEGSGSVGTFVTSYAGSPGAFQNQGAAYQIEARVITSAVAVPEPCSLALTGLGVLSGCLVAGRKRRISARA